MDPNQLNQTPDNSQPQSTPQHDPNEYPNPFVNSNPAGPPAPPMPGNQPQDPSTAFAQPNEANSTPAPMPPKKKSKGIKVALLAVLFLFLSTGIVLGTGALIAYEKIPVSNPAIQKRVSDIVFAIPFVPKTPRYILYNFWESREEIKNIEVDASLAIQGIPLPEPYSSWPLEASVQGKVNIRDENNPMTSAVVNLANQIEFEMRLIGPKNYYKLNKLPSTILALIGLSSGSSLDPALNVWIEDDNTFLNTDARKSLKDQSENEETYIDEKYEDLAMAMLNEDILPVTTMDSEDVDGIDTYKLTAEIGPEEFKSILKKASEAAKEDIEDEFGPYASENADEVEEEIPDYFEKMRIIVWIDKANYRLAKVEIYTKFKENEEKAGTSNLYTPELFGSSKSIEILLSVKLSNYDGNIIVTPPDETMGLDEYMILLDSVYTSSAPIQPGQQLASTRDVGRASTVTQMGHALEAYYVSHNGAYPLSVPTWAQILVEAGEISSVPEEIPYDIGTVSCTTNTANGYLCYSSSNDQFIVYSALESSSSKAICQTNGLDSLTWYVYSSMDGKGGYVCTLDEEPRVKPQTFAN